MDPLLWLAAGRGRWRRRLGLIAAWALLAGIAATAAVELSRGGSTAVAHSRHAHRSTARALPTAARRPNGHRVRGAESVLARVDALGIAHVKRLAQFGLPVYCAAPHGDELAFTFDDGPGPYTYLALRKLGRAGERATFFVVGRSMDNFAGWVQRETAVAAIGDHTYQHLFLPELTASAIRFQLEETKHAIEQATGQPTYFFRPPYGARDPTVDAIAKRLGLLEILWSVDSGDSVGANSAEIIRNVETGMRPGAIILMHENRGQTIRALTTLLPVLHRRRLRSVSLPELFASDPPSVAQVRGGYAACRATGPLGNGS